MLNLEEITGKQLTKLTQLITKRSDLTIRFEEIIIETHEDFETETEYGVLIVPLSNELYIKLHEDGFITYCNFSNCKFKIANALEVYKLLIEIAGE